MVDADSNGSPNLSHNGIPINESEPGYKRIRACISCRNMKIKCVSVPGSRDCETCLRFSRPCQDPGPPKARMKTSQKFTELEKKIDALTSALDAERRRNQLSPNQARAESLASDTPDSNARDDDTLPHTEQLSQQSEFVINNDRTDATTYGDVVSQGLIDTLTASLLFDHWNYHMRPLMPVIQFPPEEDVHIVRAKKPTLFLTIMTVASASVRPYLVPHLLTRLNNVLAQDVFIQGAKSLDLLQSMVLFSQYYIQPPNIRSFALPQHVYSAVVMSHDLGLGTGSRLKEMRNSSRAKETCRTLLAVYFGASCSTTLLRRHQPLLFTSSLRECIEVLTQDGDKRSDDEWLCSLITLQEIFDEASKTLNILNNPAEESFDDLRTQFLLRTFQQRIADWKQSPSGDVDPRLKTHAASVADLYIHRVAICIYGCQMQAWLQSTKDGTSQPRPVFTTIHIDALFHCLKTATNVFNTYLSLEDSLARSLSNTFLIWNLCTAVCLVRLGHFANDLSRYRTNGVAHDLPSIPSLLEAMIRRLSGLSQHGYFPQSRPFLVAFQKLKMWFQQKQLVCLNSNGGCDDATNGPVHDILGTQTPPASPPATALDIPIPAQTQINEQVRFGNRAELGSQRNGSVELPEMQHAGQRNLDWGIGLQSPGQTRILADDATATNATLDATYEPGYFNMDLGELGFGTDDIRDIDNFMMQTDDGLWSLL